MVPPTSKTVLVVEDDGPTREMYRDALAFAGYRVIGVQDGYDALLEIEASHPDAVILDLILPRVGGLDVFREMRANPITSQIPVLIVSGTDGRGLETHELRTFLRKPVDVDALVAAVSDALGRRVVES